MSLCPFIVDEHNTPSRSLASALPRLVMSNAADIEYDDDAAFVVQRAEAASASTPTAKIMQYLKQLKDSFVAREGSGSELSYESRSRRIAKEDTGDSTNVCKWRMDGAWETEFVTTTILDEMAVFEWIYAIRCFNSGIEAARENKPADAGRWFVHATATFKLLARTGAAEGNMRFVDSHPVMFKAYPCQAWALLSLAFSHVAAANVAFAAHSADSSSKLCLDGIKHAITAERVAKVAMWVMHNEGGIDAMNEILVADFTHSCDIVVAWGQFQAAVYHFYDLSVETLALDHINYCIGLCGDSPALCTEMTSVRTALTYNTHGLMVGLVTSLKGAVSFSPPESLPQVPNAQKTVPSMLPERLLFPVETSFVKSSQ